MQRYYADDCADLTYQMRHLGWETAWRDGALRHHCAKCAEGDR